MTEGAHGQDGSRDQDQSTHSPAFTRLYVSQSPEHHYQALQNASLTAEIARSRFHRPFCPLHANFPMSAKGKHRSLQTTPGYEQKYPATRPSEVLSLADVDFSSNFLMLWREHVQDFKQRKKPKSEGDRSMEWRQRLKAKRLEDAKKAGAGASSGGDDDGDGDENKDKDGGISGGARSGLKGGRGEKRDRPRAKGKGAAKAKTKGGGGGGGGAAAAERAAAIEAFRQMKSNKHKQQQQQQKRQKKGR